MRGSPHDAAELLDRVRELVPTLAAEAPEAERLRRPTDAAIRVLEESGLFRLMVPRCYGGLELDLDTFLEVALSLGEADASIAWVANFCVEHNWMLCQFPESFQRELYAERSFVLAPAVIAPTGVARRTEGGHRLDGRWRWGSGVMHASWVIVGAADETREGEDALRFFALPIEDVRVDDTWYVDGMVGTGSNDIVIEDAFVPEDRSVSIFEMVGGKADGARLHSAPLYATPMIPILLVAASTPVVGQARAAVRRYGEQMMERLRLASTQREGEKAAAQMRLAAASIEARQAELLLRDVVSEVMARRNAATPLQRARWSASITHAVHQARRVLQQVAEASGGSAHFTSHPLQRALRDANVATCHVIFDRDAQRELYGRLLLGLEPTGGIF